MSFYYATGFTPAMAEANPGTGSAYAATIRGGAGNYLDGGQTYKVTPPGPIPANKLWCFTVYNNQTRSLLPNDQKLAGIGRTLHTDARGGVGQGDQNTRDPRHERVITSLFRVTCLQP
jgi:hypothetical protein